MNRIARVAGFIATFAFATPLTAQHPASVVGCWMANRELSGRGETIALAGDSVYRLLRLHANGSVARPLLTRRGEIMIWAGGSGWIVDDSLVRVRLSTRLSGWDLSLPYDSVANSRRAATSLAGNARYITDVISPGWTPPVVPVALHRVECPPGDSSMTEPGWQNEAPTYYAMHVDVPAKLLTPLPLPAVDSGTVTAFFIVERDGRANPRTLQIARGASPALDSALRRLLPELRFEPAIKDGRPVRQLFDGVLAFRAPERPGRQPRSAAVE